MTRLNCSVSFVINASGFPSEERWTEVMLTAWCLLVELVSQFLLAINPGVYRFLVAATCPRTFTLVCVHARVSCDGTHSLVEPRCTYTHKLSPMLTSWHSFESPGQWRDLFHSGAVNAWTTGLGKWLCCCNVINTIPCYLTRPSNRAGSKAFSSSQSCGACEAGSMEQSRWYASDRPAQKHICIICSFHSG